MARSIETVTDDGLGLIERNAERAVLRAAVEATKSFDNTTLVAWLEDNGKNVRGVAGFPFATSKAHHFLMGDDSLTYVNHPDVVRPEDKFVQRDVGC